MTLTQKEYLDQVLKSYEDEVSPKDMDVILARVQEAGEGVEGVERRLSGHVRTRKVQEARDHVNMKEATSEFDDKLTQMLEEHGWDAPPADVGAEPPEPEPEEGRWTPGEGEDWDRITEKYNSGAMAADVYEKLQAERALSRGDTPLH